jgi:hypothetical protein
VRLCDILENRGGLVAMLEEQIVHHETVTLPYAGVRRQFLSKHAAAHFILQTLALAETDYAGKGIFVCNNPASIPLMEVASKLAMLNGLQLETDLPVRILKHTTHNGGSMTHTPPGDGKELVATAHARISLLRENPLPDSPEVVAAIDYLLNLQEQDLEHAVWEKPTRMLLLLEGAA